MHKASASVINDGGEGIPSLSPLPLSNHPLKYTSISNNIINKPISISIPVTQFEHFERSIQDSNETTMLTSREHSNDGSPKDMLIASAQDHAAMNTSLSSNVSHRTYSKSSIRSQLPTLINTSVSDFSESRMEIDSDNESSRRKRTLPPPTLENQDNHINKKKSVINEQDSVRDSLNNPDKRKIFIH